MGGVLASGGTMPASLHQQFVQTVAQGRLFEQLNSSPFNWPQRALVPAFPANMAWDDGPSLAAPGGLPRRQAGANLAPQLREDRPGTRTEGLAGRSPEQARKLMSAIQQGLRNSRANTSGGGAEPPETTGDWGGQ